MIKQYLPVIITAFPLTSTIWSFVLLLNNFKTKATIGNTRNTIASIASIVGYWGSFATKRNYYRN